MTLYGQEKSAANRRYYLTHSEGVKERRRSRHWEHRQEENGRSQRYQSGLRQQLITIYTDECYFCKEVVIPKDLALHHINLDGPQERKRLSPSGGFVRSWREAIDHPDRTKYAASHLSCHNRFHNPKVT